MTRILFTGYAPVHFVCFRPLFDQLRLDADTEVLVSGGLRTTDESGQRHQDTAAMYSSFDLPAGSLVDAADLPDLDVDVLVSASTKPLKPRSYQHSVQIFHGLSFRNRAIRSANNTYGHYMMLGPYMRRTFEHLGVMSPGDPRVAQIGFPKTDRLVDGSLDRAAVLRDIGFSGDRPVVMFAPTGAHGNAMELFGEDLIKAFAASGEYDLLVKPHDHPKASINWFERLAHLEDDHVRLLRTFDSVPALYAADVLISDASSIANEYLLLDRPLVFLDVPTLLASAAGEDDRLDLETWGRKGGTVVSDVAEAERAVADGLARPQAQSEIRTAITRDLFYNPGTAAEAAVAWFRQRARLVT
jgi:hypothetical protein